MSYKGIILSGILLVGILLGFTQAATPCFFNGLSMSSGQIATGYKYNNVSYASGSLCSDLLTGYEVFQCLSNGTLDGLNGNNLGSQHYSTYPYLSCTVRDPLDCQVGLRFGQQKTIKHTPDGFFSFFPLQVGHALWYLGYFTITGYTMEDYLAPIHEEDIVNSSVDCDIPAMTLNGTIYTGTFVTTSGGNTTMAYCIDGVAYDLYTSVINNADTALDTDKYKHTYCQNRPARGCSLGNIIIEDGDSITTYNTYDTPDNVLCQSEVRTCIDGTLSGSFIHTSCNTYIGSCGSAHQSFLDDAPDYNLCAGGTASTISRSSINKKWSWTCEGYGSGSNSIVSCEAYQTGSNTRGICNEFPDGASTLSSTNPGLCTVGSATNFSTTTYGWTWKCRTSMGTSSQCEASKGGGPSARIAYSTTSLTNGPVIAYVMDILPYGTVVYNNNGNASRSFSSNGSFVFALKFADRITYLTATVNRINQGPRTLEDLLRVYQDNIISNDISRPSSSRYNRIDIQTMTNLGILKPTGTRKPTLDMNKKLSRGEFIQSIYTFMQTIHDYNDLPDTWSDDYMYRGGRFSSTTRYQLGRATALDLRDFIKNKKARKTITIDRNKAINPKEVNDTVTALLRMHEDNTALRARVWSETIDTKQKSLTRAEYASMLRRLLESYDGIPIGNNHIVISKIYDRIKNKTITDQQKELSLIMQTLRGSDPVTMEKAGISLGHLLIDLNAVVNNTIPKKKGRTIFSIDQIQNKNHAAEDPDTVFDAPYDWKQDFILSPY